jgi:hypothetical protein
MKKYIIIYLIGVFIGWGLGWHLITSNKKCPTYRDVVFVSVISLLSWLNVAATTTIIIADSEILKTPINCK